MVAIAKERIDFSLYKVAKGHPVSRETPYFHKPVLPGEALEGLSVRPGGRYIDCTLGEGGHAKAILDAAAPTGSLLGIDADPEAVQKAGARLLSCQGSFRLAQGNFAHLGDIAAAHGFREVDGILFDLGISALQLEGEERGFSFRRAGDLDMRFDPSSPKTAWELVNRLPEARLAAIIKEYGDEPQARAIARAIVRSRPLDTPAELASVVDKAVGGRHGRLHPATRTFLGLRIAVNDELNVLREALPQAINLLKPGGRVVVISYHSGEDRVAKEVLREHARAHNDRAIIKLVKRKVVKPGREEVISNPRSRSAKMRIAERL